MNGTSFKDRQIKLRLHVPYNPRFKTDFKAKSPNSNESTSSGVDNADAELLPSSHALGSQETSGDVNGVNSEDVVNEPKTVASATDHIEAKKDSQVKYSTSDDTIFINQVHHKVSKEEVFELFKEYSPTGIYKFNRKGFGRRGSLFRHPYTSYFITFSSNDQINLDDIIATVGSKKLNGRNFVLRKAFVEKAQRAIADALKADQEEVEEKANDFKVNEDVEKPQDQATSKAVEEVDDNLDIQDGQVVQTIVDTESTNLSHELASEAASRDN